MIDDIVDLAQGIEMRLQRVRDAHRTAPSDSKERVALNGEATGYLSVLVIIQEQFGVAIVNGRAVRYR